MIAFTYTSHISCWNDIRSNVIGAKTLATIISPLSMK